MKSKLLALGAWFGMALLVTAAAIAQGSSEPAGPPTLYDPAQAQARPLTQAERWQLDFEMLNETQMLEHNSWRVMPPDTSDKRARWSEASP